MSLNDSLFDGMFHGGGSVRRSDACGFCVQESSDSDEPLCRTCFSNEPAAMFQPDSPSAADVIHGAGVQLAAAAAITTPTAVAVPLQTAAGTPSTRIPVVTVSPFVAAPSNSYSTTPRSGTRKTYYTPNHV